LSISTCVMDHSHHDAGCKAGSFGYPLGT
jgi:hypothetical protein